MNKIEVSYCVITGIGSPEGNLADDIIEKRGKKWVLITGDQYKNEKKIQIIKVPVFQLGELLVLDKITGREIGYPQRAPRKWDVEYKEFRSVRQAAKIARNILFRDLLRQIGQKRK